MEIWASPYKLRFRSPLSARASSLERSGALLRVRTAEGVGYADLHPWPELGDLPLETQLSELALGGETSLSSRSLAFASMDAEFRVRGVSAFAGLQIPESHFLVTDLAGISSEDLSAVSSRGFRALKIKLGRDPAREIKILNSLSFTGFRLRFDFNGVLSAAQFAQFMQELARDVSNAIEFIEDPMPWSAQDWAGSAMATRFAIDRISEPDFVDLENSPLEKAFGWCILKPAVQEPERIRALAAKTGSRLCVTSYMDHPLGLCGAAYVAAGIPEVQTCGLLTNFCLVENEWTERLGVEQSRLVPSDGAGFGFTDLLEKENWKRVR